MSITVAQYRALKKSTSKRGRYGKSRRIHTAWGWFDSAGEVGRWKHLLMLEKAGVISELERQIPYSFDLNGAHICIYKADFRYRVNGRPVVEDYKGTKKNKKTGQYEEFTTDVFDLKRKMMLAFYGIEIVIVTKANANVL